VGGGGRSSDSGLPPPPPSRVVTQWRRGGRASPLTAAGPSRACTRGPPPLTRLLRGGVIPPPSPRAARAPPPPPAVPPAPATRPLWDSWLEDAARRTRVELDVPVDREEAAVALDEALGDWRPLLARFAADRAPLWIRPRPDTNAALRRLTAAGARIGAFSDAP